MKITKNNIEGLENGYFGTIIEKIHGAPNVLNHCFKNEDDMISVEAKQDQGSTILTIDEFCEAYANKKLVIL